MKSSKSTMVFWFVGAFVVLVFYASLSYTSKGEILSTMKGEVQRCEVLGEKTANSLLHATIRSEKGDYIIAKLDDCSVGMEVVILVKRGVLYFNTVFSAQNL